MVAKWDSSTWNIEGPMLSTSTLIMIEKLINYLNISKWSDVIVWLFSEWLPNEKDGGGKGVRIAQYVK